MAILLPAMIAVALAAPAGAGLVVTSPDAATAGGLQNRLEARLAGAVVPGDVLATRIASERPAQPPATDLVLQREAERLLAATQTAFYEGNLDGALAHIADLDELTRDARALTVRVRGLTLLWRAAVFLEIPASRAAADAPVREALALLPDPVVDERSFPPSLVALAARTRTSLPKVTLTVAGLPEGAALRIDDLDIPIPAVRGAPFVIVVPAGRHRLQAWAAGWQTSTIPIDVPANLTVSLHLALALEQADELALNEAGADRGRKDQLEALAKRLGVGTLAVVTQRSIGEPIAGFLWRDGTLERAPAVPPTVRGEESLALWMAQRLARTPRVAANATVSLTPTVAAIGALRAYDVHGKGGGYSAMFGGAGARASGVTTWRGWLAEAEGSYLSYALSPVTAELPDGGRTRGNGGSTAVLTMTGGRRWRGAGFAPYTSAGASYERHDAADLVTADGPLRFFPSHRRIALEAHIGASWPRSFGVLQGRLLLQPWSSYVETPRANGHHGAPGIGFGWELGLERPRGPWLLSARARGERRSVAFRGPADAPLSPGLRDVSVTESSHSLLVTAGRRF